MSDKDELRDALEEFSLSEKFHSRPYKDFDEDIRFVFLGEQWDELALAERLRLNKPSLTINRLQAMVNLVVNSARQNRPAIQVHPTGDGADTETADIIAGLIRHIEYNSSADHAYDMAAQNVAAGGIGYIRVRTDYVSNDSFYQEILVDRVMNPMSIYGDENSQRADSKDWNKAFVIDSYTEAQFKRKWKGADISSFGSGTPAGWVNRETNNIRVAEYWTREEIDATLLKLSTGHVMFEEQYLKGGFQQMGWQVVQSRKSRRFEVTQRIISGAEILETNEWAGQYIPIVPVRGIEVFIGGQIYWNSLIKWAKDPQRQLNYWRSTATYLAGKATVPQFMGPEGFDAHPSWNDPENSKTLPYPRDLPEPPRQIGVDGNTAGALQEAMNASDDLKSTTGIYDAAMGARSNETSGIGIQRRAQQSDTATFHVTDGLSRAITHLGSILIDLIPGVYNEERIIKIRKENGDAQDVKVNTNRVNPDTQVLEKLYDLSNSKYGATCTPGPSYTTRRQETAAEMMAFVQAFPQLFGVGGDILVGALDWPRAKELAERLKQKGPPPEVQQLQQQLDMASKEIESLKTKEALEMRRIDLEGQKMVAVDRYKAETERIKVEFESMTPEAVQQLVLQTLQQVLAPTPQPMPMPEQAMPPQGPPMGPGAPPGMGAAQGMGAPMGPGPMDGAPPGQPMPEGIPPQGPVGPDGPPQGMPPGPM